MKRGLILSSFMLVFALVAVVASTYAWITMRNEAEVSEMNLDVITGDELQIATEATGPYGYSVEIDRKGVLDTVTYVGEGKFKGLVYLEDEKQYNYDEKYALPFGHVESQKRSAKYLEYDLYFRTTVENKSLYLDLASTFTSNHNVVDFLRVGFFIDEQAIIVEPTLGSGSYGEGDFFDPSVSTAPLKSFTKYLLDEGAPYTIKEGVAYPYETVLLEELNENLFLTNLVKDEIQKVTVRVWLEGWDGDALNVPAGTTVGTYLKFVLDN